MPPKGSESRKRGRPEHVPTKKNRAAIKALALLGTPYEVISKVLGISADTLTKYYADELEKTRILANAAVAGRLYKKAMAGNVPCMIFWMKTRAGWKRSSPPGDGNGDGGIDSTSPVTFIRGPTRKSKQGAVMLQTPEQNEIELADWAFDASEDNTDFREFYATKGLGAGGTYNLAMWHLAKCLVNYKSPRSWVLGPTYQQVIDPLIPTFTEVMSDRFRWEEGEDYTAILSQNPRIELPKRKQVIFFKSANRPDRLVGSNISHLSGTEPGLWPELAFQKSFARVRCPRAVTRQKFLEGTPEGLGNGFERRANFAEGTDQARNRVRFIVRTSDNELLPEGYIPGLIQTYEYDPQKLDSYLNGNFTSFVKGSAYWEWVPSRNTAIGATVNPAIPIVMSWDFDISPLVWVALQRQPRLTKNGFLYHDNVALKETGGKCRGLQDACAEFVAKFPPSEYRDTPVHLDGGHDGFNDSVHAVGKPFDQIRKHLAPYYSKIEIVAPRAAPERRDRLNQTAKLMVYERHHVSPDCKNLIESYEQTNLKPGTWEIKKPEGTEANGSAKDKSHYGDAASMALFRMTKNDDLVALDRQSLKSFTGRV